MSSLILYCVASLIVISISASGHMVIGDSDEPDFCNNLDCPKYTLVSKKEGYEVRNYDASRWVGITMTSNDWFKTTTECFELLYLYITGENRNKTDIPMATPVATKIVPVPGGNQSNYTVLFFTPFKFKQDTPKPSNPKLAIVDLPAITAYVISFGGFERNKELEEYSNKLMSYLERDGTSYVKDAYFTAGYDTPYKFINRHNEVWYTAP